ncbi:phosphatase PAP2 family protein [Bradyrhizobium sp.]|uniref:phosphatase PAP2 family protein n=1 Tax=Bradyrhizobium sp. TaxID=376 RepID=UPI003C421956
MTSAGVFASGLSIDFGSNRPLLAMAIGYTSLAWFYHRVRPDERLYRVLTTVAQLVLILVLGLVLSYAAAVMAMSYRDAELLAIDRWLGFDRASYVHVFTDQPWKIHLSNFIYLSMLPQLAFVPLVLVVANRIERLQQFVMAYGLALAATIAIFVFVPAVGAFVYCDLTPAQYATLPADIYTPARTLDALRSGMMKTISLSNLEGLIAFPSFHTAAAILDAWALWPVKPMRWLIVPLNVAMVATTPIVGAHYAIDVVAGAVVTLASIAATRRLCSSEIGLGPAASPHGFCPTA